MKRSTKWVTPLNSEKEREEEWFIGKQEGYPEKHVGRCFKSDNVYEWEVFDIPDKNSKEDILRVAATKESAKKMVEKYYRD